MECEHANIIVERVIASPGLDDEYIAEVYVCEEYGQAFPELSVEEDRAEAIAEQQLMEIIDGA